MDRDLLGRMLMTFAGNTNPAFQGMQNQIDIYHRAAREKAMRELQLKQMEQNLKEKRQQSDAQDKLSTTYRKHAVKQIQSGMAPKPQAMTPGGQPVDTYASQYNLPGYQEMIAQGLQSGGVGVRDLINMELSKSKPSKPKVEYKPEMGGPGGKYQRQNIYTDGTLTKSTDWVPRKMGSRKMQKFDLGGNKHQYSQVEDGKIIPGTQSEVYDRTVSNSRERDVNYLINDQGFSPEEAVAQVFGPKFIIRAIEAGGKLVVSSKANPEIEQIIQVKAGEPVIKRFGNSADDYLNTQ